MATPFVVVESIPSARMKNVGWLSATWTWTPVAPTGGYWLQPPRLDQGEPAWSSFIVNGT